MKTKFYKSLVLILTLALMLTAISCGKTETTDIGEPVNQDKTTQNNDISNNDKQSETPSSQDKMPSKNEQDKETGNNPQDKPDLKPETPSSDTPDVTVSEPETPETTDDTTVSTTAPSLHAASAYIGKSAGSLAAAIGQPSNKTYVTSCIGDGEDGEWYYPGFTVYTYCAPNGSEKVIDVLAS